MLPKEEKEEEKTRKMTERLKHMILNCIVELLSRKWLLQDRKRTHEWESVLFRGIFSPKLYLIDEMCRIDRMNIYILCKVTIDLPNLKKTILMIYHYRDTHARNAENYDIC